MSQSGYTPDQALQAQTALAKQGLNAKEILTASPAALTLSAATGSSVNEATATMTEMLHSFNMGSDQFDRIADVLALASNQYGMDIRAVGAAMKSKATTGVDIVSAAQQIAPSERSSRPTRLPAQRSTWSPSKATIWMVISKAFASWDSLRINLFSGQNAACGN